MNKDLRMLVLGLGDYTDCGSALLDDSTVVAAINDERIVRQTSVLGIPRESIRAIMALAGVQPDAVDMVAVGTINRHLVSDYTEFLGGLYGSNGKHVDQRILDPAHGASRRRTTPFWSRAVGSLRGMPAYKRRRSTLRRVLRDEFGITAPVRFVDHHYCHATAAYFTSDFGPDATVFTIDYGGDDISAKVFDVTEGRLTEIMSVSTFDSVGTFYTCIAEVCGCGPGRVSGLADYGRPAHADFLDSLIGFADGGFFNKGPVPFEASVETIRRALPDGWAKVDLAASLQAHTERLVLDFVRYWVQRTGHRDVALGGGLFDNALLNKRIHELDEVERCFAQPGMSDSGIGAALAVTYERVPRPQTNTRAFDGVYLGPEYGPDQMEAELDSSGVQAERPEDLEAEVASLLAQGALVSRFSGRMECGSRGMGNRGILFQPTDPSVNDWLNQRLGRSGSPPFEVVVLEEYAEKCFHGLKGAERAARFMTMTFSCTDWMRKHCPGVVQVDGKARPQIVRRQDNPGLHRILEEYRKLTGLPALLSTGFSFQEEPMVCTPADAVRVFGMGHLDYLALGPFLSGSPPSIPIYGPSLGVQATPTRLSASVHPCRRRPQEDRIVVPNAAHHFTVDIEEYFHSSALEELIPSAGWDGLNRRAPLLVSRLLDHMDEHGVRGTFFVLGWMAEHEPDMVREIASRGHEVASHGWDHKRVTHQSAEAFQSSVGRAKQLLEDLTGQQVLGFRAPSFSILPGMEWALDALLEEGYRYDSSLFPIKQHVAYGYPEGERDPYWIRRGSGSLAEFPPATLRLAGTNLPAGGGAYFRLLPYSLVQGALRSAQQRSVPGTFYIHPWELDLRRPQDRALPGLVQMRLFGGRQRIWSRLDRLVAEFRFCPISDTLSAMESRTMVV